MLKNIQKQLYKFKQNNFTLYLKKMSQNNNFLTQKINLNKVFKLNTIHLFNNSFLKMNKLQFDWSTDDDSSFGIRIQKPSRFVKDEFSLKFDWSTDDDSSFDIRTHKPPSRNVIHDKIFGFFNKLSDKLNTKRYLM